MLTPLGIQQAAEQGKSVLFLLEANPGPGLGLLLAYSFFGKGLAKASAPGRRDHPVLRRHPRGLLPLRPDEAEDDPRHDRRRHDRHLPLVLFDVGLRAPAAPGSIFAVYAADPERRLRRHHASASSVPPLVSFLIASVLLQARQRRDDETTSTSATAQMEAMKGKKARSPRR